MKKRIKIFLSLLALMLFMVSICGLSTVSAITSGQIIVGASAPETEKYAARELQRYLYEISGVLLPVNTDGAAIDKASFVVGQKTTNSKINTFVTGGYFTVGPTDPGPEGYLLKKFNYNGQEVFAIAGSDAQGSLYGVYGLLDDYYGVGFYLGGDVLPDTRITLNLVSVDEKKGPRQYIRGFLPWTNFPQSATVYSFEDYKFIIDQMTKMRMNFIHIHNYNGEAGHNEMFHNFTYNGITSRVWMATAKSGHAWAGPGWSVGEYRFKAGDLFEDGDFGSDCTLHNRTLLNMDVFRKGSSLFQRVLQYAHSRGVKIGLGLDINLIPSDYGTVADNPAVVDARVDQVVNDYPDLDFLLCFRSEGMGQGQSTQWNNIFNQMYNRIKAYAPQIRIAVSGWGIDGTTSTGWPSDVICAPISAYSAACVSGSEYGTREYWGCPWLERDFNSSVHYYPYNMNLSDTVSAYAGRAANMKGFLCLTWRLTDAVDAKMSYIAKAPWDFVNRYNSSQAVYNDYSVKNYGSAATSDITGIINQNEPYACDWSECVGTYDFTGNNRSTEINKAAGQLSTIDYWINSTGGAGAKARLKLLRCRIEAAKAYCELDQNFPSITWAGLPGSFETWARDFRDRVTDISSLGNVQSSQNRYVQLRYVAKEDSLRSSQTVKSPSHVVARGTSTGAVITWKNEEGSIQGFNVYRGAIKLNGSLLSAATISYTDTVNGTYSYTVTAVNTGGQESSKSVPSSCKAGNADTDAPNVVVISAPTSSAVGQPVEVEARVLDDRTFNSISATLYYRTLGTGSWNSITMTRRVKAIFTAKIPGSAVTTAGLEYYITASDSNNTGYWPKTAPAIPMSLVGENFADTVAPGIPGNPTVSGTTIQWPAATGDVYWYNLYRSTASGFTPSAATFVTYVYRDTTSFRDKDSDFDGNPLNGTYYYKVTAVDKSGNESAPSAQVALSLSNLTISPYEQTYGSEFSAQSGIQVCSCSEGGDCIGYIDNGDWIKFSGVNFGTGAIGFEGRVASYTTGGNIEIRLDSLNGTLVGTCPVQNTGDWQKWVSRVCNISGASGTHDLYFKFTGGAGALLNISWFKFYNADSGYQAENALLNAVQIYDDAGASGSRAVGWFGEAAGDNITFANVKDGSGLTIVYANGTGADKQCSLYLNGSDVATLILKNTGGWYTYSTVTLDLNISGCVKLQVDSDDLAANANNFCGNVDFLNITGASSPTSFQAENATLNAVQIYDDAAAVGGKAVGWFGEATGDYVLFNNVPNGSGVTIIYANGNGAAKQCSLYVNGVDVATVTFQDTGSWYVYNELTVSTNITGSVKLQVDSNDFSANGGNCCGNVDMITIQKASDHFNSGTLGSQWSWVREDNSHWSLTAVPGAMRIVTQSGDVIGSLTSAKNLLLEDVTGNWSVVTKVTLSAKPYQDYQQAGLIIYQDDNNYLKLVRCYSMSNKFAWSKEINGTYYEESAADGVVGTMVYLKIAKNGSNYTAYYSTNGVNYTRVGTSQYLSLSPLKVGLIGINGPVTAGEVNADFDYVNVSYN